MCSRVPSPLHVLYVCDQASSCFLTSAPLFFSMAQQNPLDRCNHKSKPVINLSLFSVDVVDVGAFFLKAIKYCQQLLWLDCWLFPSLSHPLA